MKAIRVKYHGATNFRGSRLIADDGDGNRIIESRDPALRTEQQAFCMAVKFAEKWKWRGKIAQGYHKNAYYHVLVD